MGHQSTNWTLRLALIDAIAAFTSYHVQHQVKISFLKDSTIHGQRLYSHLLKVNLKFFLHLLTHLQHSGPCLWHNISPVEKADSHVLSWDSVVQSLVICFTFSWVALDHLVVWLKTHLWWTLFFNFYQFVNLGDLVNSKCIVIGLVGRHHWRVGGQRIVDSWVRHLRLILKDVE